MRETPYLMKYRHITLDELDQESPPQLFQMFTLSAPLKSYSELKIFRKKYVILCGRNVFSKA